MLVFCRRYKMSPFVDSGWLIESTFCTVDPFCWQCKKNVGTENKVWYTSTDNMLVYWHEYQKDTQLFDPVGTKSQLKPKKFYKLPLMREKNPPEPPSLTPPKKIITHCSNCDLLDISLFIMRLVVNIWSHMVLVQERVTLLQEQKMEGRTVMCNNSMTQEAQIWKTD